MAQYIKYGSLALVIVQNSSHVLLLRYSRVCPGECKEYTVRSGPPCVPPPGARSHHPMPRTPRRPAWPYSSPSASSSPSACV